MDDKFTLEYMKGFKEDTDDYFENNPKDKNIIFLMPNVDRKKLNEKLFIEEAAKIGYRIVLNDEGDFILNKIKK